MPRELAADPEATVFEYGAGISVPHDWEAWGALCRDLAEHLVERYGIDEVAHWGFEVWNEANLEVFWTGTRDEYFLLYDLAVEAVKSVDARLLVGGPATAAAGWIPDFLDHVVETGAPLDFLTTHTYGNLPLDVRESLRVRGLESRGVVDGVGRDPDALLRDQRQRVLRDVPAARHEVRAGAGRRARLLGRSATTSRSSGARPRCCTAASAC